MEIPLVSQKVCWRYSAPSTTETFNMDSCRVNRDTEEVRLAGVCVCFAEETEV